MKWYFINTPNGWKRVYKVKNPNGSTLGKWIAIPEKNVYFGVDQDKKTHANTTKHFKGEVDYIDLDEIGMGTKSPAPFGNSTTLDDINKNYYGAYLEIACEPNYSSEFNEENKFGDVWTGIISNAGHQKSLSDIGWLNTSTTFTLSGQGQDVETPTLFSWYSESSGKNVSYKVSLNVWNGAESGYTAGRLYFRPHADIEIHSTLTQTVHWGLGMPLKIKLWYWADALPDKNINAAVQLNKIFKDKSNSVWEEGQKNLEKTNQQIKEDELKKEQSIKEIEKWS